MFRYSLIRSTASLLGSGVLCEGAGFFYLNDRAGCYCALMPNSGEGTLSLFFGAVRFAVDLSNLREEDDATILHMSTLVLKALSSVMVGCLCVQVHDLSLTGVVCNLYLS